MDIADVYFHDLCFHSTIKGKEKCACCEFTQIDETRGFRNILREGGQYCQKKSSSMIYEKCGFYLCSQ